MKKILYLLLFIAIAAFANAQGTVNLKGEFKDGDLVFTFENTSGKTIANCNFQLQLPEGVTLTPKGKKYQFTKGDATEDMVFSVAFKNDKYTITIYDGEFDESAGNTIISLPLQGEPSGKATVSNIAFGDPDGINISRPNSFDIELGDEPVTGSVEMKGEVKDNSLVFTYANTTGKAIGNCSFQFVLPTGMSLVSNGGTYKYEKGAATVGMTFSVTFSNNKYTVKVTGGKFNESAGNTIVTLPLEGKTGGKATVSNVSFGDANGSVIGQPANFTMDIPAIDNGDDEGDVKLNGEYKDGSLVFTFENTSGKTIANCNFQLALPEGVELKKNSTGKKYLFEKGDATEDLTYSIKFANEKYTITIYDGEFDESAGNTIITLPLQGEAGGKATVSNIAFGDPDGKNISRPEDFTLDIPDTAPVGSIEMKGEVKDNSLVFTYANTTGKVIGNCSFQLALPTGMSLVPNGGTYKYEKGAATAGMTFSVTYSNNRYTVKVSGGKFNESAGNIIVTLPLEGKTGGKATVSNVSFEDDSGSVIGQPAGFTMNIPSTAPVGSVDLKGEVKDNSLVFTFANTTGEAIGNCSFQLVLPTGMSLIPNEGTFKYEKGDATENMRYSIAFNNSKYTITVNGGKFDESAGNTIITLPLQGKTGGKATIGNIIFADLEGNTLSRPNGFTMDIPATNNQEEDNSVISLKGDVVDGSLVFTFANNSGKTIANCNFQLQLPEGVTLTPKGKKYQFTKGDATEDMVFSIAFNNNKYTITVYDGEFDESAGNTIISLPLQGTLAGFAKVSNIAFGDADGKNICRPEAFDIDLTSEPISGSVDMKGEVKDGSMVFTFENNTGRAIANANFQLVLPEGVSLKLNSTGNKYQYERGNATKGMSFSIELKNNKYAISVYGGKFDETAGNTIISLPLEGKTGGMANINNIMFADSNGNILGRPNGFTLDIPAAITTGVDMKGEVKDGNMVFSFENTTGTAIANCNFQFVLPEGVSVKRDAISEKCKYEEGNATKGLTFYIAANDNKYTVIVYGGEFKENAGNTIISLPLQGQPGGKATVSNITFSNSEGKAIGSPDDFNMDISSVIDDSDNSNIELKGEVKDNNLVFTFENTSGKTIANCNFQLQLPEGVEIKKNSTGKKYLFEEGDATEGMTYSIAFKNNKYTISIYDGEFDESAGNTIISLTLQGESGGKATVENIAFGDPDGKNICRPESFTMDIPTIISGSIDLKGEVKDGNLVFTFDNTTGKAIANANFQFELPEGVSVMLNSTGKKYLYEKGDATADMTFSVTLKDNKYTVAIYGGEFNATAGNTIISLPLQGKKSGKATVSNTMFADSNGNIIGRAENFSIDIPVINTGSVELKGEVKDTYLVFTFANTTGKSIANANFQFELPQGITLISEGNKYKYEEGDATKGMEFAIAFSDNKYSVTISGGVFNEAAGNTIISLPLQGRPGGKATVSNIAFGDANGNNISSPKNFTMDIPTITVGNADLKGEVKDGSLVFTFDNTTGKDIASCHFQFVLPEGLTLTPNGNKYEYEVGDATKDMTFSVALKNNKYTVAVYGGKFNETAGNTIISLPLRGKSGGKAIVSNIAFGDSDGNNISHSEDFAMDLPIATYGVDMKAEFKDHNLVFTFENNTSKSIANCNFQFELPEGVSVKRNQTGKKYLYEEGDATKGMTFYVTYNNNKYTVAAFGGEFNETAGNIIISLALQGRSGGEATVSNIAFGDAKGNNISRVENFTMDIPSAVAGGADLKGEVKEGNLVFMYENNSGTAIANCNFQFELPEGVSVKRNSISNKCKFEEGDATEGMTFYIASNDNRYTVAVFGGEFDEKAGKTIVSLPLEGVMAGEVNVSNIAFGDSDGYNISRPDGFSMAITGVGFDAQVKDDHLVFTYENNSGKPIGNCNFQFMLPEGMSLTPEGEITYEEHNGAKIKRFAPTSDSFKYEEGDATAGMIFSISCSNNVYTISVSGGQFDESAGNTIVSLPLQGKSGGEATVSDIAFADSEGETISMSEDLTIDVVGIDIKGEVKDGCLVFKFEDNSLDGKPIGNCNFQFVLPEGLSLTPNGNKYLYAKGDATEDMSVSVALNDNKYTVTLYDGEFNKTAGTIISLPLQGKSGGEAAISSIAFGDTEGNISSPDDFIMDIPAAAYGIDMNAEFKDGNLVLTFDNNSGKTIGNCNFQMELPEGLSVKLNPTSKKFSYEEGDATAGMAFSIAFSNNVYIVTVSGGEFNEKAGQTIITLPLQGWSGGKATISDIIFGGSDGNTIGHPEDIMIEVTGTGLKGDVDGNGSVGLGDIEAILKIMAGGAGTRAADVDGSGGVGLGDIESILRIMAGGQ